MRKTWSAPTTPRVVALRAGGRRRLNRQRQQDARLRPEQVLYWYAKWRHLPAVQARLAEAFDLSPATISRYVRGAKSATAEAICPMCGMMATEKTLASNMSPQDFAPEVRAHPSVGRTRTRPNRPASSPPRNVIAADGMAWTRLRIPASPWRRWRRLTAMILVTPRPHPYSDHRHPRPLSRGIQSRIGQI